mmetsp:Transcript_44395/g.105156  ORF Transcript_44395/g.105156 Transcript_44395/m.105156 type:complete len:474 (+) Transcript_44395:103-1524(+)
MSRAAGERTAAGRARHLAYLQNGHRRSSEAYAAPLPRQSAIPSAAALADTVGSSGPIWLQYSVTVPCAGYRDKEYWSAQSATVPDRRSLYPQSQQHQQQHPHQGQQFGSQGSSARLSPPGRRTACAQPGHTFATAVRRTGSPRGNVVHRRRCSQGSHHPSPRDTLRQQPAKIANLALSEEQEEGAGATSSSKRPPTRPTPTKHRGPQRFDLTALPLDPFIAVSWGPAWPLPPSTDAPQVAVQTAEEPEVEPRNIGVSWKDLIQKFQCFTAALAQWCSFVDLAMLERSHLETQQAVAAQCDVVFRMCLEQKFNSALEVCAKQLDIPMLTGAMPGHVARPLYVAMDRIKEASDVLEPREGTDRRRWLQVLNQCVTLQQAEIIVQAYSCPANSAGISMQLTQSRHKVVAFLTPSVARQWLEATITCRDTFRCGPCKRVRPRRDLHSMEWFDVTDLRRGGFSDAVGGGCQRPLALWR